MLVAYVSDERYVALPDVLLEFEGAAGSFEPAARPARCTSTCRRATYKVTLQKPGFGAKSVQLERRTRTAAPPSPPASPTACSATPGPSG